MKHIDPPHGLRGPQNPHRLPEVSLAITRGAAQRRTRPVRPPLFLIGAAADCDLVLGDPIFPPIHTYLYVTAAGVSARHIGEGPDLCINGQSVETARLAHGDVLRLGGYEFRIQIQTRPTKDDPQDLVGVGRSAGGETEIDPDWQHLQLLLCELPAPLRPQRASAAAAASTRSPLETFVHYQRRAIA